MNCVHLRVLSLTLREGVTYWPVSRAESVEGVSGTIQPLIAFTLFS